MSRMIQAADDVGISQQSLTTAMEAATRKGIDVSIAGMQAIADQYLALGSGLERGKFLMDTFGRSGADMAPYWKKAVRA